MLLALKGFLENLIFSPLRQRSNGLMASLCMVPHMPWSRSMQNIAMRKVTLCDQRL